jgi:hypothetical protein
MPKKIQYKNRIELLQGALDMLILQRLQWGPQHGYRISQSIGINSGEALRVETGSLYPALHRLERQGGAFRAETSPEQTARPLLPHHHERKAAIGLRSEQMGADHGSDWFNHACQAGRE